MDTSSSLKFIEKAINKTKSSELSWTLPPKNFDFKPLPEDETTPLKKISDLATNIFLSDYSYVSKFKNGYLTLSVFQHPTSIFTNPPEDCILSLRMQDNKSRYAVEISNSSWDPIDLTQLIRLYNLIAKDSSSVSLLIDDFLNS